MADLESILNESDDAGVRILAAIKLGEVPTDEDSTELAEGISKWISHPKLKPQVLTLLAKLGTDAIPTLTQLVTDSRLESELKTEVLSILLKLPDVAAIAEPLLRVECEIGRCRSGHIHSPECELSRCRTFSRRESG